MTLRAWRCLAVVLSLFLGTISVAQDDNGRIKGRVVREGAGVGGAIVLLVETARSEVTDDDGGFEFANVPAGTYTLIVSRGDDTLTRPEVAVAAGATVRVLLEVDWKPGVSETITVTAAARAAKIVDAPAAVTSATEEQIEQQAPSGQVPKILEFTPGAEVTQSGLYDFNFNTRGFNSSLNRRVSTYIDGRDVGVVLLGAQEWAAISGGLDDVANLEFIRGPSAALYGANASSGVINITTKAPRDSAGTLLRLTGGELDTRSMDFRWAGKLGGGWYSKVTAGFKNSGDFTVSRDPTIAPEPEYSEYCMLIGETDCLPEEKALFRDQDNEIRFGSVRFDRYLAGDALLSFEAGLSDVMGPVFQTGIGRVQTLESKRPFYRFNFSNEHWNVLAHYARREGNQVNLTRDLVVNYELLTDTERYGVEGQGNWQIAGGRGRVVVGAAHTEERVDTVDPSTGLQTVVYEPLSTDRQAVFSQFDWKFNDSFKLVLAGRMDASTLHDTQFSPKAALVYSIDPKNSFRLTYNRAFQVANYSEFFLHTRISAFPIGGFVQVICGSPVLPAPVDCGIDEDFIPILAVGNDDLDLEKTGAWELGYSGLWANRVFVTVDYYNSKNEDFITDLVPQVGTILGNLDGCVKLDGSPETDPKKCPINNDYPNWVGTDEAENTILIGTLTVAQALRNSVDRTVGGTTLGFRLAQDLDGSTVVIGRTYTNIGDVNTQGIDFSLQYFITRGILLQANYSWFDFEILDSDEAIADILLPNSPEHKASLSFSLNRGRWSAGVSGRWVEGFRWSAGVFQGDVDDYYTVDLGAGYAFNDVTRIGLNVANATDHVHRQTFGGDLLSRRALLNLTFAW